MKDSQDSLAGEASGILRELIAVSDVAWKCLQGAYDLQIHVGPDVIGRRIDDIDCARQFLGRGLKGFVLKSHYVPTGERAQVVNKAVPGIAAVGAITLNHSVGGTQSGRGRDRRALAVQGRVAPDGRCRE